MLLARCMFKSDGHPEHGPRPAASCVPTVPVIGASVTRPVYIEWGTGSDARSSSPVLRSQLLHFISALDLRVEELRRHSLIRLSRRGFSPAEAGPLRGERLHRRSGDPPSLCREGKLELTEAPRLLDRGRENSRRFPPGKDRKGRSGRCGDERAVAPDRGRSPGLVRPLL